MDCRDTLNKMYEENWPKTKRKGYWAYANSFEKIYQPVQLRWRFVFHAVILLLICGVLGGALFIRCMADGATPPCFTPMVLLIPYLAMAVIAFWSLYHAYSRRKKELAGGEVRGYYTLSSLRWGHGPLYFCFWLFIILLCEPPLLHSQRLTLMNLAGCVLMILMFSWLPWSLWRDYTRIKKELAATDTVENSSQ